MVWIDRKLKSPELQARFPGARILYEKWSIGSARYRYGRVEPAAVLDTVIAPTAW